MSLGGQEPGYHQPSGKLTPDFPVLHAQKQVSTMRHGKDSSKGKRETAIDVDFDFAFCN